MSCRSEAVTYKLFPFLKILRKYLWHLDANLRSAGVFPAAYLKEAAHRILKGGCIMTEHTLMSENCESLEVTAVADITNFDENSVLIVLQEGALSVKGRSLRITQLDLDTGRAALNGEIISMTYIKGTADTGGSLLRKLMR